MVGRGKVGGGRGKVGGGWGKMKRGSGGRGFGGGWLGRGRKKRGKGRVGRFERNFFFFQSGMRRLGYRKSAKKILLSYIMGSSTFIKNKKSK